MAELHYDELAELRLKDHEKLSEERWTAHGREHTVTNEAYKLANLVLESRLEKMNQLREEWTTMVGRVVTRELLDAKLDAIYKEMELIRREQAGGRGSSQTLRWAIGVGLAIAAILATYFSTKYGHL